MKNKKRLFTTFAVALAVATVFSGCSSKVEEKKEAVNNKEEKTVALDAIDREVVKPSSMEKLVVTCYGGTTH